MIQEKPEIEEIQGRVNRGKVLLSQGTTIVFAWGFREREYYAAQEIYSSIDDEDPFAVNEFCTSQEEFSEDRDNIEAQREAFENAYRAIESMEELSRRMPEVAEAIQEAEGY